MTSQIISDQTSLSEKLQLLQELSYSILDLPSKGAKVRSNSEIRYSRTKSEILILDVIAICLTTGEPGDVVAVAFDRREHLSLVLAKNGPPTLEDELATRNLISAITDPEVAYATDIFYTPLSRCRVNMEKRMNNLHQSISHFGVYSRKGESKSTTKSIEEEFPGSTPVSARELQRYRAILSYNARRSSKNLLNAAQKWRVEKLKRRLAKVCQYYGGVTKLIKRYFPDGHIPYRWVNDYFIGSGEGQFKLCDHYLEAVQRAFGFPLSPQTVDALREQKFPDILSNWALSTHTTRTFTRNFASFFTLARHHLILKEALDHRSGKPLDWMG
ncbi:hypothetical protein SCP_0211020 [Sparassis crispa]|uniref:Uncharacterized protein n=1 Tax=Sparassis crispa TaxID=139825 RepID=A0A401GCL1_9APHY|nr:hypothetical protein SCP_0211020 [Sparassis crispa]GBE79900.1 hypothetical protein SCP_0211020 [Sparassis crispa]